MDTEAISRLREQIQALPQGGITFKTISGKSYAYYQWRVDGKQKSRRVRDDEFDQLSQQIEERKRLQAELMQLDPSYSPRKSSGGRRKKAAKAESVVASRLGPNRVISVDSNSIHTDLQNTRPINSGADLQNTRQIILGSDLQDTQIIVSKEDLKTIQSLAADADLQDTRRIPQITDELIAQRVAQRAQQQNTQQILTPISQPLPQQPALQYAQVPSPHNTQEAEAPSAPTITEEEILKRVHKILHKENVFSNHVRTGETLNNFILPAENMERRECFEKLNSFLKQKNNDRIFLLYGLRKTGKTTLMRQAILDMDDETKARTAFIQISRDSTFEGLRKDLEILEAAGIRYVFADEITLIPNLLDNISLLAEIFAAEGMKIVLSGDDSLELILAENHLLYGVCDSVNTTSISFRDHEVISGRSTIDDYLTAGGVANNRQDGEAQAFADCESTNRYVKNAITANIIHSFRSSAAKNEFKRLQDHVNREGFDDEVEHFITEMNNSFAIVVMMRDFMSNSSGGQRSYVQGKGIFSARSYSNSDQETYAMRRVAAGMRELYRLRVRNEQSAGNFIRYKAELREILNLLDVIADIDVIDFSNYNRRMERTVFTQPGIRCTQAKALVESLLEDDRFRDFSLKERKQIAELMNLKIQTRMMEDTVLLETMKARRNCRIFVLQFATGSFDMVVFDPKKLSCEIYKIINSENQNAEQFADLLDKKKCDQCETRYGTIKGRFVIYKGKTDEVHMDENTPNIRYINVEEFLRSASVPEEIPVDVDGVKITFLPL